MKIGVLALQGAFIEHERRIAELGATPFEIRRLPDIDQPLDGLILPGGESTVQGKLLHELGLFEPLKQRIAEGLPTFGTCAGLILLARNLEDDPTVHFGLMDITAGRNAYGRQLGSFAASERMSRFSPPWMESPLPPASGTCSSRPSTPN